MPSQDFKTDFCVRLSDARKYSGYTQSEISKLLGVSVNAYQNWERCIHDPQVSTALKIAQITKVNPAWLLAGRGNMHDDESLPETKPIPEMVSVFSSLAELPEGASAGGRPLYRLPRPHGVDAEPLYAFEVVGDCMYPAYKPGDVVFAVPESIGNIRSGEDVVVLLAWNEFSLKRWNPISEDRIELISLNRNYRPLEVQRSAVRKLARVVAIQWADAARKCISEFSEK